jgi:hypothetical protein
LPIQPLHTIIATKVVSIKTTKGSAPFEVMCGEENEIYFAKTTDIKVEPFTELICEVVGNYFSCIWGLQTASPCLIKIPPEVVAAYIKEIDQPLPPRYAKTNFNEILFFGVKSVPNTIEIELYMDGIKSKKEFNLFNNPLDLIKIGALDFWLGNKDRKPNNPNILLSSDSNKFNFVPIDHAACFGYSNQLKSLNSSQLFIEDANNILSSGLAVSILKYSKKSELLPLIDSIKESIDSSIEHSEEIFSQVPSNWGFSKKAKENIIFVLSEKERNLNISKMFVRFKPKK